MSVAELMGPLSASVDGVTCVMIVGLAASRTSVSPVAAQGLMNGLLFIPIGIQLNSSLLHEYSTVVLFGVEYLTAKITWHVESSEN